MRGLLAHTTALTQKKKHRYVKNTFDPASASTIGASFLAKKVVVDDCLVRLQVSFPH